MNRVSAVICAYNEESTIEKILKEVSGISSIHELIVVNDGSLDQTGNIIESLKLELPFHAIHLPKNMGKGYAIAKGVEASSSEFLVFIDADLSNLSSKHINQLITPVIKDEVDMVLGQATETRINHNINPFKFFSGQRALRKKDILPILKRIKPSRFGVETIINLHFQSFNKRIKYVNLQNLKHPTKFDKTESHIALKEFFREGQQIFNTAFSNWDLVTRSIRNSIINSLNI
ncbi:MAG: glycosyltransferase family 2 protein [Bacteroidales bacterium]|nr:glycosyltransferase family 2 protein [Bacteroidales bacterium]